MKLKKAILPIAAGLALLVAGGMRVYSRIHSKPSAAVEQQLSQNSMYAEIVAQTQNPLKRELFTGLIIDYGYPLYLRFHPKFTREQRKELRESYHDPHTGKPKPYDAEQQAILWHAGADPTHPHIGQYYLLNSLAASAFQKP